MLTNSDGGSHREFTVLVPIDFTNHSCKAVRAALRVASSHPGAKVVLLHSFMAPYAPSILQLSDSLNLDDVLTSRSEASVIAASEARTLMADFCQKLRDEIAAGTLPAAKFSTEIMEGVPEECIVQWAKEKEPQLIVMGTRPAAQKEKELVGSVSAEVLDSCRFPALTIPETSAFTSLEAARHIALFSTLEEEDFLALKVLQSLLPEGHSASITLVCLPTPKYSAATTEAARNALLKYCRAQYPEHQFTLVAPAKEEFLDLYSRLEAEHPIDLTVVPNRRKNIFARLFNPGIAHRVLFHFDIPMMVIPV